MFSARSSASSLALAYLALVLYASLYPFSGWRWPPGQSLATLLVLPKSSADRFDLAANLAGYLPLGLLIYVAAIRHGKTMATALRRAALGASALSYATEITQHFLPGRVPSLTDWSLNTGGALAGASLAALLHRLGALQRWQTVRDRWFVRDTGAGLALLALWPAGLLFPAAVPLGLGQIGARLHDWLLAAVADWPLPAQVHRSLMAAPLQTEALGLVSDALVQGLGLLAPCLLSLSMARAGWRRGVLILGAMALGFATTTLSAALSFGPDHALAWRTPMTPAAWAAALLAAAVLAKLERRTLAVLALITLAALVVLVARAPADPYFAQSLQSWERGRFIHFNGLALWIGWLWPYLAMIWLLQRLRRR